MRLSSIRLLFPAAVCVVLLSGPTQAQTLVTGLVDDSTGIGLPGVLVDAVGVPTDDEPTLTLMTYATVADATGHYRLDLPPGRYSMRFRLSGFGTVVHENIDIDVEVGYRVVRDARLRPTELREGVTVAGAHPYAASSSMAARLPPVRRPMGTVAQASLLVERAPTPDAWMTRIERQVFATHIQDACLGYAPMWLHHLDVVLRQRPCQVAWLRGLSPGATA